MSLRPVAILSIAHLPVAAIVIWLILQILGLNNGVFIYTLDDPYIHLAMSEQIARGNYGVNTTEYAAASSSILYPFLLALGAPFAFHQYLPLAINLGALFFSVEIIRRFLAHLGLRGSIAYDALASIAAAFSALGLNLIGVAFSGMEHSLHVALSFLIIFGLALYLDTARLSWWLVPAIILCPLFRYEGLAISVAAIGILALRGAYRSAIVAALSMIAALASFSLFLLALGLPPLPSSVLAKSGIAVNVVGGSAPDFLQSILSNFMGTLTQSVGRLLIFLTVCTVVLAAVKKSNWRDALGTPEVLMAAVLVVLVGSHTIAGRYDWFYRYEVYLVASAAMLFAYLAMQNLRHMSAAVRRISVPALGIAAVGLVLLMPYTRATLRDVPLAANNIYEQQYQMHRFVTEFHKAPVAVNDLGWVSFHNPHYVLDLWGLGSEEVRLGKSEGFTFLAQLAVDHHANLAIVYEEWLIPLSPSAWTKVATMHLSGQRVTAASTKTSFYATRPEAANTLRAELSAFAPSLPAGVRLEVYGRMVDE